MGELGGVRDTRAEFKNSSLITYLFKPDDKVIDITATRTINPTSKKTERVQYAQLLTVMFYQNKPWISTKIYNFLKLEKNNQKFECRA